MLTRAEADQILTTRLNAFIALAALGSDAFVDALGFAIRALGLPVASMTDVTDADLAQTVAVDAVLDLAELRLMETIFTNYDAVSVKAGPVDEKLGEIANRLMTLIPTKRANVSAQYGHLLVHPLDRSDRRIRKVKSLNVTG